MKQQDISGINQIAWNQSAYRAWVNRYGKPSEYAQLLIKNPRSKIEHYLKYTGCLEGKRIANLLGSNGNKAVSFGLLGAEVTVVDISEENCRYAMELANAAGVNMHYIVSDVLDIPMKDKLSNFDVVILELGVLHYFIDLLPLFKLVLEALKPGGVFILRDYHPIVSKLLNVEKEQLVANGNYFETELEEVDVAYRQLLSEEEKEHLKKTKIRRWTLGEIVTSAVAAGLTIKSLEEEAGIRWTFPSNAPENIEHKVPGLYTIIAEK